MKTVLMVDDDDMVLNGLCSHVPWAELGISRIERMNNGIDALQIFEELRPDIVVTDIYMPHMDGLHFVRELRERYGSVPIVILSGYDNFENARKAIGLGVSNFLLKPAGVEEITEVLRDVLRELEADRQQKEMLRRYDQDLPQLLPSLRGKFLHDLITTRYQAAEISRERARFLGLADFRFVLVMSLQLIRPHYLSKSKEREWQLLRFGASNIIQEALSEELRLFPIESAYSLDYSENQVVFVWFGQDGGLPDRVKAFARSLMEQIVNYLKMSVVIGIGRVKCGLHETIDSYLESQKVLERAEYQSLNCVYDACEGEASDCGRSQYPLESVKDIHECIFRRDFAGAVQGWRALSQNMRSGEYTLLIVQSICSGILSSFFISLPSPSRNGEEIPISRWIAEIYCFTNIMELVEWMERLIGEHFSPNSGDLGGKRSNELISKVIAYVEENYQQDINLAEIAKLLYVNKNYLSQLFKRVTGETFVSHLNKYRIEKAVELLLTGQYMIYEVGGMVGYQSPSYFSQVFRSVTGRTPSDYCMTDSKKM